MQEILIELQNISCKYKELTALKNVNLKVKKGDSLAIIGPNGSGKSTMLKLLNGIVFPTEGKYYFSGEEILQSKLQKPDFSKEFHKRIGFVFQNSDAQLFCSNVYEEVAFGPRQMNLNESDVNQRVYDCLNLLGIEKLKHREPYHLSEGEKRKVAISAVLALNPEVLILDEPMTGLDPKTKLFLNRFLIQLNKAGKTIICSTHDFEYIHGIFHKIIVFSDEKTIIREDLYDLVMNDLEFLKLNNLK